MTKLEIIEWTTILLLIKDVSPKRATWARLKFAYNRANWTGDIAASTITKREKRLDVMLRRAFRYSRNGKNAQLLKLIEWDLENDTFSHGSRAAEFLGKATAILGASSPDDLRPLKRWVNDEHQRLQWC